MTVITYLDKLKNEGDKENAFHMASRAIGSAIDRTFFIANYTHKKDEKSFVVERTALDILDFALLSAERFIRIKKQREKNQMQREVATGGEMRMIADESWRGFKPTESAKRKGGPKRLITSVFRVFSRRGGQIYKKQKKNQIQGEVAAGGEMRVVGEKSWRGYKPTKGSKRKGGTLFRCSCLCSGRSLFEVMGGVMRSGVFRNFRSHAEVYGRIPKVSWFQISKRRPRVNYSKWLSPRTRGTNNKGLSFVYVYIFDVIPLK